MTRSIDLMFPIEAKLKQEGKCPTCSKEITEFRDDFSQKEFNISGMCQNCQDSVFGSEDN